MRIVIDLQGAQTESRHRGIGRYTLFITRAMISSAKMHEFFIILSGFYPDTIESIRSEFDDILPQNKILVWEAVGPVKEINPQNAWRRAAAERLRETFIAHLEPDFVLLTTLFEGLTNEFVGSIGLTKFSVPTAVILYDLIPLANPETYLVDPTTIAWYENKQRYCENAQLLLSISEFSKHEACTYLDFDEESITNISSGASVDFRPMVVSSGEEKVLRDRMGLSRAFLMYTSATDDRKNHLRLIEAYAMLPQGVRRNHQLAFIGRLSDEHKLRFVKHAQKCGLLEGELIISGQVSDEEMVALYNLCKAFVFPSWHEGFGMPALEAMLCGKAVIASNKSSLPEVIDREDALFDPFDVQSISAKIGEVLSNDSFRFELEKHGLKQSKHFSWDASARLALEAIEFRYKNFKQRKANESSGSKLDNKMFRSTLIRSISDIRFPCGELDVLQISAAISQNHPANSERQLLVDISELIAHDLNSGIQRVTKNILYELLLRPPSGVSIVPVYANQQKGYYYACQFERQLLGLQPSCEDDYPVEIKANDIFLGLDLLTSVTATAYEGFYQYLRNHGVLVYFIVYDLLPLQFPEYANYNVSEGYLKWLKIVLQGDGVFCISNTVAGEIRNWISKNRASGGRPFKIDWFHLGANIGKNHMSTGQQQSMVIDSGNDGLFGDAVRFLMVGTVEPRKAHEFALDAFDSLWADGMDVSLIIVGSEGWLVEHLSKRIRSHDMLGSRLFWLEDVDDVLLDELYGKADCLIAASEGEGFGLPLIEAAQHDLPIIARRLPIFEEVAGEYAYYFDRQSSAAGLAASIKEWVGQYKSETHPKSGLMQHLSWEQSAQRLISLVLQSGQ